ncbi:hypothetical protein GS470_24975 [Rhodococcus hoagii]|nr:hypothetical protein [Prescottella equi]
MPQSVFGLIGMRREAQIEYLEGEITELRIALDAANERGAEFSVKQIENAIKGATSKIENLVAAKSTDEGLTFEQSGADFCSSTRRTTTRTSHARRTARTCQSPTAANAQPTSK